ncbi:hypothetical protein HUK80_04560 [Flavobacterium sp. MAH-1]|uniref:ABC-2 type transport system permease protein n=1 Tax=Flavobacterium agri TaxID=2743471 RepID=A0A7Y8Y0F1_9FLAO|nr:DUF5687 family protein [Flavobacterium agri]NUY80157.1 hypothetical protein [Flavobacterium agri]NYA70182.1 hypothetical protein [Flavobacterium agri]
MFKHFFMLETKAFFRSSALGANLAIKIILGIVATFYAFMFCMLGFAMYPILKEQGLNPLEVVNKYLIFYMVFDLTIRYFMQKMPVMNIKPLLILNVKRNTVVHFAIGKSVISFFNAIHLFWLIPFTVALLINGHSPINVLMWHFSIAAILLADNFINLLINNKDAVFYPVVGIVLAAALCWYYDWYDVTVYTQMVFSAFYETPIGVIFALVFLALLYWFVFKYYRNRLYLDTGLAKKNDIAKTENFGWLDQFGEMGVFLKNDIRLLKRNKRSRTTVVMSVIFIFYGLLFYTNAIEQYRAPMWQVFAGIFVSGGFLFTFGQFVPSWDSSYYPLMMSQNIKYKDYLASKWWLMVIATVISTILASFYLVFGWKIYMLIVVGAIYNIGVNSHLVLLGGAFVKTPIDLTSGKQAFGNKQAFNVRTLLITVPKLLVPMLLYALGFYTYSAELGFILVAGAGLAGFAFRNKMFTVIERIYRTEKYKTIAAYKGT